MRRIRDFLCGLAFAAFSVVSLWGVILAAQAFPEALRRQPVSVRQWLIERDLSQVSPAVRSRVARQIEDELRGGGNLTSEFRDLTEPERELLERNLDLVLEQWYRGKVSQYFDQPAKRRTAWLDREIKEFETAFRGNAAGLEPNLLRAESLPTLALIIGKLETWIGRADPEMQQHMREFQQAVQERVLTRRFRRTD